MQHKSLCVLLSDASASHWKSRIVTRLMLTWMGDLQYCILPTASVTPSSYWHDNTLFWELSTYFMQRIGWNALALILRLVQEVNDSDLCL